MYETILFELNDGVAQLVLNRPSRMNSFTEQMHAELSDALSRLESETEARALLITGAGRGFCAGQDLMDRTMVPGQPAHDLGDAVGRLWNPLIQKLTQLPMPVICAVNGVAAGAGVSVALACDIVLAARSAKLIMAFSSVGLIPDSGGTWVLPKLIGLSRAMGMALTAEPISAERAESWGLIWKCVDDEVLASEAIDLATRLAQGPTKALSATKRALRTTGAMTLDEALHMERDLMRMMGFSKDYAEGVAAFIEKRPARFNGR